MIIWSPGMSLEEAQEKIIDQAYKFYREDAEASAKSLQISLDEFNEKIEMLRIKSDEIKKTLAKEKQKEIEFHEREKQRQQECYEKENIPSPFNNRIV